MIHRTVRAVTVAALATALTVAPVASVAGAAQSGADPSLTVAPSSLPADRISTVTVTGRGYLVPPHAPGVEVFGGVYVFFGWVANADHFGPSIRNSANNDGTAGATYAYPGELGDAGTRDDGTGTSRLVAFTAGGESGDATDFHMDDNGNWSTTVQVYGSSFTTTTPDGSTRTYDCLQVQCGVFTIGAHGVASATNEQFAPITFQAGGSAGSPPDDGDPAPAGGGDTTPPPGTPGTGPPAASAGASSAAPTAASDLVPGADDGSDPGALVADTDSVRSTGGMSVPVLAAAALLVAALATGLWWWRRRRRSADPADPVYPALPTQGGGTNP